MKKKIILLLTFLLIGITGCSSDKPPDITGLVYSVEGTKILVVEGIDNTDIPYEQWSKEGKNAISFEITKDTKITFGKDKASFDRLKKGQQVKVWSTGALAESYPMQGTAKKIVIIED